MTTPLAATPVTPQSLNSSAVTLRGGLYPGFYPGGSSYPGGGNDLVVIPATPTTLTAAPA